MPGRKSAKIELSEQVRQALEKRVARHTTGQQKAQRARIMLKAAEGKNPTEIARELKVSIARVALGCERWLALAAIELEDLSVEERLEALARPGAPSRLSADYVCQIEQMACAAPDKAGRPIRQWTGRAIADELMKRGIVEYISRRHAVRLLKKGGSNRTGCATI